MQTKKDSFKRWLPLIGLTFAVFVFNTPNLCPSDFFPT